MDLKAALEWKAASPPEVVTSREALETRLRDIAGSSLRRPVVVCVSLSDGIRAYVGLGRKEGMLFVHGPRDADGLTPEWISVGDDRRRGETSFWYLGDHNDYEERSLLPIADAISGVGELFETGRRPTWIRWEENRF